MTLFMGAPNNFRIMLYFLVTYSHQSFYFMMPPFSSVEWGRITYIVSSQRRELFLCETKPLPKIDPKRPLCFLLGLRPCLLS